MSVLAVHRHREPGFGISAASATLLCDRASLLAQWRWLPGNSVARSVRSTVRWGIMSACPDLVGERRGDDMAAWPVLQEGDQDSEESNGVYKVQRLLRHHGFDVVPDHVFGPLTAAAVQDFQNASGLDADGIVGSETWLRLIVQVQQGDSGEAVFAVQSQWRFIIHDGMFGPRTDALVRDFQQISGLDVDGIVGQQTWQRMGKGPIIDPPDHLRDV